MDPHALLRDTLDRRFADGSRRAVLVIGAGLHHHLAANTAGDTSTELWRLFRSWNDLLKTVGAGLGVGDQQHEDPTATWESLIVEGTRRGPGASAASVAARDVEKRALRALSKRLADLPSEREDRRRLGRALRTSGYRDLISLNFDRTLEDALGLRLGRAAAAKEKEPSVKRPSLMVGDASVRIWFPHGHVSAPDAIVLGHRAYGMAIDELEHLRDVSKQADRAWRKKAPWTPSLRQDWEEARRAPGTPDLSWMDLFLLSDLIFVGCSLDRGEMDLWWALHQRARNHARQRLEDVPRTLLLHGPASIGNHLASGPAGVTPVRFEDWNGLWEAVVGPWWSGS